MASGPAGDAAKAGISDPATSPQVKRELAPIAIRRIDKQIAAIDKKQVDLGPYAGRTRETLDGQRNELLEQRLQVQADLGIKAAQDAIADYHAKLEQHQATPDVDAGVRDFVLSRPMPTLEYATKLGMHGLGEYKSFIESVPEDLQKKVFLSERQFSALNKRLEAARRPRVEPETSLENYGSQLTDYLQSKGLADGDDQGSHFDEFSALDRAAAAFAAPSRKAPVPAKIEAVRPTTQESADATAVTVDPTPPEAFKYGPVIEGFPSSDYRNESGVGDYSSEDWESEIGGNMAKGVRGGGSGNRSETRIAVALEAPDGRVVLAGLTRPQATLGAKGVRLEDRVAVQRMGTTRGDRREVEVGGAHPAVLRDVVEAGYRPIGVLHFAGEPGRIFDVYKTAGDFDQSYQMSEKTAGDKAKLPHAEEAVRQQLTTEAQVQARIDQLGTDLSRATSGEDRSRITDEINDVYRQLQKITAKNQGQVGDVNIGDVPFRTTAAEQKGQLPADAGRAGQFQAVIGRYRSMGARVDEMAKEYMAQSTRQAIVDQINGLRAQLEQAKTESQRRSIQAAIDVRLDRMNAVESAVGATYTPYHMAIAMEDVANANLGNLVTALHEGVEMYAMRLTPEAKGKLTRAIGDAMSELSARTGEAAEKSGAAVAPTEGAMDFLSEHLAQKFAAEGIPDAPNAAQAVVRWIKDLYYRVAMAAQRAFGKEPDPQLALDWFENQMRRVVFGDYDYRLARLVDRYLPEPFVELSRRFQGHGDTPGGIVDYLDPVSGQMRQPSVDPISNEAVQWNVQFRHDEEGAGKGLDIPDPEARARINAAAIFEVGEFAQDLHKLHGGDMKFEDFWRLVGRGDNPAKLLQNLEEKVPGLSTARVGGDRMTSIMDGRARLKARILIKKISLKAQRRLAESIETVDNASADMVEAARKVNKLEGDVRNATAHEDSLQSGLKDLVRNFVRSYKRGLDTAQIGGELSEAIRNAEGLLEGDPLPERYAEVFKRVMDGQIPVFDYVRGIADLDLDLNNMTNREVMRAIRDNADGNPALERLAENRPLAVALAVLARRNATQVDQIQLGWLKDSEKYMAIQKDLAEIRNASEVAIKDMIGTSDAQAKAKGLRARLKAEYIDARRDLRTASNRTDKEEQRGSVLRRAIPSIQKKVEEMQAAGGGSPSEWQPREGAKWSVMTVGPDGKWTASTKTLKFNPDGSAVDGDGIKAALSENWNYLNNNKAKAGSRFYESVHRQTETLQHLDVQRKYHAGWVSFIDRWIQPITSEMKSAGHSAGARGTARLLNFEGIQRDHRGQVDADARWWTHALVAAEKSAGITDHGVFHSQIFDPIMYYLGANPGLDEEAAIRRATRLAKSRLPKPPDENFGTVFAELLRRTKTANENILRIAESNNAFVRDPRIIGELRRAVGQGWLTNMRSLRGDVVQTIIRDMEQAGWKLKFNEETSPNGETTKKIVGPATFSGLSAEDLGSNNTDTVRKALQPYFTESIISSWLEPFIHKPGEEILSWKGEKVPQLAVRDAWSAADHDVLAFIDALGTQLDLTGGGEKDMVVDPVGTFRLSMLRQIDKLFGMEAKMAYDAAVVRNIFDPMGPKPHVIMDARLNELIPPEHLQFQYYDPTSSRQLLAHVAFHGAFGRNGEGILADMNDLNNVYALRKSQYGLLRGTTEASRMAEAAARGWDYKDLKAAAKRYQEVQGLGTKLKGMLGVDNPGSPFYDLRAGFELLHTIVGGTVDEPKVGAYHLLSIMERPFAMRSLGPRTIRSSAGGLAKFGETLFGSLLQNFNIHILRTSDYMREVGAVEGSAFRNLPWGVALSDIGQGGRFQASWQDKWLIRPLRMIQYAERKGVRLGVGKPGEDDVRLAGIPGMGVINTITQAGAMANTEQSIRDFERAIKAGINHFQANREDFERPSFRFEAKDLGFGRLDTGVFDYLRNKTVDYNMGNLEDIVRDAMPRAAKGDRLMTKDQVLRIAQMTADDLAGQPSLTTTPSVLYNNKVLRYGMPLLNWATWKMHKVHEGLKTADGRFNLRQFASGLGTLALWNLPIGLAFTFLMDEYDDKLIKKKATLPGVSPIAGIPIVGPAAALATSKDIPATLSAFLQRAARAGNIYGLGMDAVTQIFRPLDLSTGQRQFSMDQRVFFMSQALNIQQAIRNMISQGWNPTWDTVGKPLFTSLGGNGMLHSIDITNNVLGLDNTESRLVRRINASNWIRSAAQESGVETRSGGAGGELPTPMSSWVRQMQLAAMANDRAGFLDDYRKAKDAARAAVAQDPRVPASMRETEAEHRVLASWRGRDPLEVLRFKPTNAQLQGLYSIMDPDGEQDVREAIARFHTFTQLIQPTRFDSQMGADYRRDSGQTMRRGLQPLISY